MIESVVRGAGAALVGATAAAGSASASGSSGSDLLGGTDLLRLLVLAFGGALVVGHGLALWRSRSTSAPTPAALEGGETPVVPQVGRCMVMIAIGLIAAIWAVASLTS